MSRRPCFAAVLLVAFLAGAQNAAAVTVLDTRVAASGATAAACQTKLLSGSPGVVTRTVLAPSAGSLQVRLDGGAGDWDVALFGADGRQVAAAASPDAQEVANGWAFRTGLLTLQACRRPGAAASVPVTVTHTALTGDARQAKADAPQMVSVDTPTRADKDRLVALGLDMTEHGGTRSLGVVLHGAGDRAKLEKAGFSYRVLVKDLVAKGLRDAAAPAVATDLPSRRTSYRTLADYETELKQLAAENPTLVRLITLPNKTWGGKDVLGVEIAENVTANDGRPAFANLGVHHAREWPSGEHAMEWAIELVTQYKAGVTRAADIVRKSRNLVVPIVNPDGFEGSRSVGQADGNNEATPDTVYIASSPGEYRRKNCRVGDTEEAECPLSVGLAENGTDPNRNYGQFWGGPGSDTNPLTQTYRGPGPFSEPESRNIQWLVSHNQVTTLITNHTTAGLILRAPGLAVIGPPVDETRGYQALGDAMAKHNGYFSQKGYELYDTTGTTEDWSYNATGGYGFTFEIYCGAPNYQTGDCDDPAFHPRYATMAAEWSGDSPQANHSLPGAPDAGFDGQGNREAYYLAAESTIDEARHSILEGSAPAGTRLRLTKKFKTETFPQPDPNGGPDKPGEFEDSLETVYDVGASGAFRWHVNPSTRPIVAKAVGEPNPGTPSPPRTSTGNALTGSSETEDGADDGAAVPATTPNTTNTASYNDHPFTIPTTGDNRIADIRVEWLTPASDWDVHLYEDTNGNGRSDAGESVVATSATGPSQGEELSITTPVLAPGKKFVLRAVNFAGGADYTVTINYEGPPPYRPAKIESYTLSCERADGTVVRTQPVVVERAQTLRVNPCEAPAAAPNTTTTTTTKPATTTTACAATAGFSSVGVRPSGSGLAVQLAPRVAGGKATVSVFQQSVGRRITGERLVARFRNRSGNFTWRAKGLRDGYYFVRYTLGKDTRRITLRRSGGKFTRVADFYRRASCDLLPSYKLSRPVFGGTANRSLSISYRASRRARVTVTVTRAGKVVKRFPARNARSGRVTLPATGLARGEYQVKLVARAGSESVTSTLTSRRL